MIQANELRIGNIVVNNSEYSYISSIDSESGEVGIYPCFIEENEVVFLNILSMNGLQPAPLTEELLLKCGSTSTVKGFHYHDRFSLRWVEAYKYWYVTDMETGCYITKVEFLHEWQNTWYVLQGEELNIEICKTDK